MSIPNTIKNDEYRDYAHLLIADIHNLRVRDGSIFEDTLTVNNLTVAGEATIQDLTVIDTITTDKLVVNDTITTVNLDVTGTATIADLTVTGTIDTVDLNVSGTATVENLNVADTITTADLNVTDTATINNLTVTGAVNLPNGSITHDMLAEGAVTLSDAAGSGVSLIVDGSGPDMTEKTLVAGANITLQDNTPGAGQVTISAIGAGFVTFSPSGTDTATLVASTSAPPNLVVKDLSEAAGITLTNNPDDVFIGTNLTAGANITITPGVGTELIIAATGGGGGVSSVDPVVPPGPGEGGLVVNNTGAVTLRNIKAGTGITVTENANDITIAATGGGAVTFNPSGTGTATLVAGTSAPPNLVVKDLTAGTGIMLTNNAQDVVIDGTYTLNNAGPCDVTLIKNGTGPAFELRGLSEGPGITLAIDGADQCVDVSTNLTAGTNITITPGVGSELIIASTGGGVTSVDPVVPPGVGEASLVVNNTGAVTLRNIKQGTGVTVTQNANDVTISAGVGGATLSDGPGATGVSLILPPAPGPTDFLLRTPLAGAGISITQTGTADLTITNTGAGQVYTLADDAASTVGPNTASVVSTPSPTASDFRVRRFTSTGGTVAITQPGADINLEVAGGAAVTLASEPGGITIVTNGVGPSLMVKHTESSPSLADVSDADGIAFDNFAIRISGAGGAIPPVLADAATNTATNTVVIGPLASSSGNNSVILGLSASSLSGNTVVIGNAANIAGTSGGSVVIGVNSTVAAASVDCVAIGNMASVTGASGIAIGPGGATAASDGVAIGRATSAAASSTAVGRQAQANGSVSTALGFVATASGANSTALGRNTTSSGSGSTSAGQSASASNTDTTAIGRLASSSGLRGTTLGISASAAGTDGIALGSNSISGTGINNIAIGGTCSNTNVFSSIVIGRGATIGANGTRSVVIGFSATTSDPDVVLIGRDSSCLGPNCVVIGAGCQAGSGSSNVIIGKATEISTGFSSVAIGCEGVVITSDFSVSIGQDGTAAQGDNAIALGRTAAATATSSVAISTDSSCLATNGISIGNTSSCDATAVNGMALGTNAICNGASSVNIGHNSQTTEDHCVTIGESSLNAGDSAIVVGRLARCDGDRSIAVGRSARCYTNDAMAVGDFMAADQPRGMAIGQSSTTELRNVYAESMYMATKDGANPARAIFMGGHIGSTFFSILPTLFSMATFRAIGGTASYTLADQELSLGYILLTTTAPTVATINLPTPWTTVFSNAAMNNWKQGNFASSQGTGGIFVIDNRRGANTTLSSGTDWAFMNHSTTGTTTTANLTLTQDVHIFIWNRNNFHVGRDAIAVHILRANNAPL